MFSQEQISNCRATNVPILSIITWSTNMLKQLFWHLHRNLVFFFFEVVFFFWGGGVIQSDLNLIDLKNGAKRLLSRKQRKEGRMVRKWSEVHLTSNGKLCTWDFFFWWIPYKTAVQKLPEFWSSDSVPESWSLSLTCNQKVIYTPISKYVIRNRRVELGSLFDKRTRILMLVIDGIRCEIDTILTELDASLCEWEREKEEVKWGSILLQSLKVTLYFNNPTNTNKLPGSNFFLGFSVIQVILSLWRSPYIKNK